MNKYLFLGLALLAGTPLMAQAGVHVYVGGGYHYHYGYRGPHYYAPYYGYYGYYGPAYYYSPGYYYPPPQTVYAEPETTVVQAPANYWYYCAAAKAYYPYVSNCPGGWEAVPAQTPQARAAAGVPAKAPATPAQSRTPAGSVVYRFGDLLFASGEASLQPAAESSLSAMLDAIRKDPSRHITVEGHTDSSGDANANHDLSQRRAEAVKQFLVEHGVPEADVSAVGKGADDPIGDNKTAEGRKLNRRVDVIVG